MSQNRINELKKEFTYIVIIKNDINELFNTLLIRVKKLKDVYNEIMKTNKSNNFIFGLDSFKFQSKLMDVEYEDLTRMYKMISNKMYCEYYKLYKIIIQYVESSVKDTKLLYLIKSNEFPIYKDLEPYRDYDFTIIQNIHETILTILLGIFDLVLNNKEELKLLKNKKDFGLSIDNFINSYQYNVDIIIQQIKLYCDYITFFHKTHLKYLKRIHTKLQTFFTQISSDIRFEDSDADDFSYKCDADRNTIESVKSLIYENDDLDHILNKLGSETHTDDSEFDDVVYESMNIPYQPEYCGYTNEVIEEAAEAEVKADLVVEEVVAEVKADPVVEEVEVEAEVKADSVVEEVEVEVEVKADLAVEEVEVEAEVKADSVVEEEKAEVVGIVIPETIPPVKPKRGRPKKVNPPPSGQ
jgi:hypothetical protein